MSLRRTSAVTLALGLSLALGASAATATSAPVPASVTPPGAPRVETADDLPAGAISADGPIDELARYGDTLWATGSFHRVGHYAGPGAVLSASTGATAGSATIGDGQVSVVVGDGAGGWYLGGDFTRIGGHPAGGLAHVLADGDVDLDFQPDVDGLVSAVALSGDTLWFGGEFEHVDGTARSNLAAVSVADGTLLPFDAPQAERVTELAYAPLDGLRTARLLVGSDHLEAVDPVTGLAVPGFTAPATGDVHALLVAGSTLYVGDSVLRAVDLATGSPVPGFTSALPAGGDRSVHALLASGSTLYVGTDIAGDRLVALDAATGARRAGFAADLAGTNATFQQPGGVFDLALDGDRLWVGGAFTSVAGEPAGGLAVLDATTGAPAGVAVPSYDQQVNAVELSGDQAYVGGTFWTDDWVDTQGLAAFDATTLEPRAGFHSTRWNYGDLLFSPDVVYVADNHFMGYDTRAGQHGGYYRSTSTIDAFDPATGAHVDAIKVKRMAGATTIGDRLYVVQRLQDDVRYPRNRVLVLDAAGRRVDTFPVPLRGYVTTMETVDGDLLLGGSFLRTVAHVYPHDTAMLRLDPATGARRTYFDPKIHGPVYDIAVDGHSIYAAGLFKRVDQRTGGHRAGVVKLSPRSRLDTAFVPEGTHPSVLTRLRTAGGVVWPGGDRFLDATTGARTADPTGWSELGGTTWGLAPSGSGTGWASYLTMNLGGSNYFRMGFVASTTS